MNRLSWIPQVSQISRLFTFVGSYVRAALWCLYLFTIGFVFQRNRSLLRVIYSHFDKHEAVRGTIPLVELTDVVSEDIPFRLWNPIAALGNISLLEAVAIAKLVQMRKPSRVFEIGTFDGRTTLNIGANAPPESLIYTLDLSREMIDKTKLPTAVDDKQFIDKSFSGSRYLGTRYERGIVQLYGDSATFDFSPFLNQIDFVFIDGSHSFDYVTNDSNVALRLLRDGKGVILWHDYDSPYWEGVTRGLDQLYSEVSEFKGIKHIRATSLAYLIID